MRVKIIVTVLVLVFSATSCGNGSSVNSALAKVNEAMDKVEKNKTSMSEADWKALNDELTPSIEILNQALESDKVGALQKIKITAAVLRFAAVAGEAALHTAVDSLKVRLDSVSSIGDSVTKALNSEEAQKAFNDLKDAAEQMKDN